MACGPNRAPGRFDVPPSKGAPMIMMSVPAQDCGSARSALGTPRKDASGPYMPPSRAIADPSRQSDDLVQRQAAGPSPVLARGDDPPEPSATQSRAASPGGRRPEPSAT